MLLLGMRKNINSNRTARMCWGRDESELKHEWVWLVAYRKSEGVSCRLLLIFYCASKFMGNGTTECSDVNRKERKKKKKKNIYIYVYMNNRDKVIRVNVQMLCVLLR